MSMQKYLLTLLSASVFVAGVHVQPAVAQALPAMAVALDEDDEAYNQLTEKAGEQYEKEEYASSVALFERAYEIRPEPNILFNIGRIYEEWGKNKEAIKYYERFITDTSADYDARQAALKRLALLRELVKLQDEKGEPKDPDPQQPDNKTPPNQTDPNLQNPQNPQNPGPGNQVGPNPPPQVPEQTDPAAAERRKKLRPTGYALLGVGVAGGIVGAIMGGLARNIHGSLDETAPDINERRIIEARGRNYSTGADVMFGIGGALAITGIILIAIPPKKASSQTQRAHVRPQVSPTGLGLTGRF